MGTNIATGSSRRARSEYIRDFDRLAETTATAQELYDKMMDLDPHRVNRGEGALWKCLRAVKP